MRILLFSILMLTLPVAAAAQERLGTRPWGPWGPTYWDILQMRTRCEGSLPMMGPLPTRWRVAIRNDGTEPVFLDYTTTYQGNPRPDPRPRRVSIKAGSTREVSADFNIECAGTIVVRISNVRVGNDAESTPYLPPDTTRVGHRPRREAPDSPV